MSYCSDCDEPVFHNNPDIDLSVPLGPSDQTKLDKIVQLTHNQIGNSMYAPVILPGNMENHFLIDTGASRSCIDVQVFETLPLPRPTLYPTSTRFRTAKGAIMVPSGVIHLPIIFFEGHVIVCHLSRAGHCILGSDAGKLMNVKLDWAKGL
jgi:predicted aspartyl protease